MSMIRTLLAALLLLAGSRTAFADGMPWTQVTAAAEKGGTLNIYHNTPPPGGDNWLAVFHDAFPKIAVEATRLGSGEMAHRFTTETAAGVSQADVVMTLWDDQVAKWVADGWVRAWVPPESSAFPAEMIYRNSVFTVMTMRSSIISNTTKVRAADAPKEWVDLFDPKWKGQIGMDPPWRSVAIQALIAYWEDIGIKDAAKKLKANDVRFFNGSAGVLQAIIRGDVKVAPQIDPPVIPALADGAPVRIAYPASGVPAIPTVLLVPAKAPHPEIAMLFVNWAMSAAGQQSLQDKAGPPAMRPGTKPPTLVPGNDQVKLVLSTSVLTPERQKAIIDEYRSVFGVQ